MTRPLKHTLKNRPSVTVHSDLNDDGDTVAKLAIRLAEMGEWFKGFEAELRQLKQLEANEDYQHGFKDAVNLVLGETE